MTITGGPRIDDRRVDGGTNAGRHADADAARQADVALLRSVLSGLAGASGPTGDDVAHRRTVNRPECRATRAAMHGYVKARLVPSRVVTSERVGSSCHIRRPDVVSSS